MATERRRPDIIRARNEWIKRRQPIMQRMPERLVFIPLGIRVAIACRALEETSVKTNMTRLRGRAPMGQRLVGAAPFGKWRTQTFIAGLAHEGMRS